MRELAGMPAALGRIDADLAAQFRTSSRAVAHAIDTTLSAADQMLRAAITAPPLVAMQAGKPNQADLRAMLKRLQGLTSGAKIMVISDASGRILVGSHDLPDDLNIADRAFFRLLRESPNKTAALGSAISQVGPNRVDGKPVLHVARRYENSNGHFGGVVVVSIDVVKHFEPIARHLIPSPTAAVGLLDENQRILMRLPHHGEMIGKHLPITNKNGGVPTTQYDEILDHTGLDGILRVGMMQALEHFPLHISVSEPRSAISDRAQLIQRNALLFIIVLLTAGGALSILIWRSGKTTDLERLRMKVFAHAREGILITDPETRIIEVNPRLCQMSGYSREELIGQKPSLFHSGRHDKAFYRAMWDDLNQTNEWRGEIWNRRKDGGFYAQHTSISAVRDQDNRLTHYIGLLSDITTLKSRADLLEEKAQHDILTQLPNRALLHDRLQLALARARRDRGEFAICYIDLDEFKPVNDHYGHAAGDTLLIEISARLRSLLRGGDTAARVGGDEFVLILTQLADAEECRQAADRVLTAITAPVVIDGHVISVSASIGIALYPRDGKDANDLLMLADQAMYEAKRAGRNRYSEYA
jgi:diguanylate cyclase (GGDEF)-like protein/PAS domain S-box-containing protein